MTDSLGKFTIKEPKKLNQIFKAYLSAMDEANVRFNNLGMNLRGMGHSQVTLTDITIPKEIFESYPDLNDEGITSGSGEFVPWSDVQNERIAFVSSSRTSPRTGGEVSAGGKAFFRFECSLGRMEYPMSSLDIEPWKLDLLLYIYRGRYEAKRN